MVSVGSAVSDTNRLYTSDGCWNGDVTCHVGLLQVSASKKNLGVLVDSNNGSSYGIKTNASVSSATLEALWPQEGEGNLKCEEMVQGGCDKNVETQEACQEKTKAKGHQYYVYWADKKLCHSSSTCKPVPQGKPWKLYKEPPTPAPTPTPTPGPKCPVEFLPATPLPENTSQKNCDDYVTNIGCEWTLNWNCPGQTGSETGKKADACLSLGYCCCCREENWKRWENVAVTEDMRTRWKSFKTWSERYYGRDFPERKCPTYDDIA